MQRHRLAQCFSKSNEIDSKFLVQSCLKCCTMINCKLFLKHPCLQVTLRSQSKVTLSCMACMFIYCYSSPLHTLSSRCENPIPAMSFPSAPDLCLIGEFPLCLPVEQTQMDFLIFMRCCMRQSGLWRMQTVKLCVCLRSFLTSSICGRIYGPNFYVSHVNPFLCSLR